MNITIVGRLTGPPEIRFTGSGKAVCNFDVAENHRKKNARGEYEDAGVTFWRCTAWEQTAENIAEANWQKAARVIVVGDSYTEDFQRKDGTHGTAMKVKVTEAGRSERGFSGSQGRQERPADDPWGGAPADDEPPF